MADISTKPYMLRAIHEWCMDSGFTPYIAVQVTPSVKVPIQFVRDGQIVLNVSYEATNGLKMDNTAVQFRARFGGVPQDIYIPVANVIAIYASENGQGMAFEMTQTQPEFETPPETDKEPTKKPKQATLTRIK